MSSKRIGDDLALFAINTGELYSQHLALARMARGHGEREKLKKWRQHVLWRVRPLYAKKFPETYISGQSCTHAARELMVYYGRHVEEVDG